MGFGEVREFNPEAKAVEDVRDLAIELHRVTIRGGNMQTEILADRNLGDRVDVASTGTDITDPSRSFA